MESFQPLSAFKNIQCFSAEFVSTVHQYLETNQDIYLPDFANEISSIYELPQDKKNLLMTILIDVYLDKFGAETFIRNVFHDISGTFFNDLESRGIAHVCNIYPKQVKTIGYERVCKLEFLMKSRHSSEPKEEKVRSVDVSLIQELFEFALNIDVNGFIAFIKNNKEISSRTKDYTYEFFKTIFICVPEDAIPLFLTGMRSITLNMKEYNKCCFDHHMNKYKSFYSGVFNQKK
jgi:hypothetical protein